MFFLKKVFLGFGLLVLLYLGSSGTQSNSLFMQGMGFIGLIIGLVILYIFGRMVWKGLGCLPSFLILSAVVLFMMYALGMFNNGLAGVGQNIMQFIGYGSVKQADVSSEQDDSETLDTKFSEEFPQPKAKKLKSNKKTEKSVNTEDEDSIEGASADLFGGMPSAEPEEEPEPEEPGMIENMFSAITGDKKKQEQPKPFNPNDYPVIYGSARVINGDTLEIYGKYFQLFGIDAPESNQTCANRQGRSYNCGREAAMWLKNWIGNNELECHVLQQDTKGNMVGTCSYGPYDLGAALVNAGWAVAYVKYTDIYYPYEMQAQKNRRGLWQGTFYKPWDWRKLQSRKAKIKVIRPKERKKTIFN